MKNKVSLIIAWVLFIAGLLSGFFWAVALDTKGPGTALATVEYPQDISQGEAAENRAGPNFGQRNPSDWRKYAAHVELNEPEKRPKIALVLTNLGRDPEALTFILDHLPQAQTLGLLPSGKDLLEDLQALRGRGREVLLTLPMEPNDYPIADPGEGALLTSLSKEENDKRLYAAMTGAEEIVGYTNFMGDRFLADKSSLIPIFAHIKETGSVFLEADSSLRSVGQECAQGLGLPYLKGDFYVGGKAFIKEDVQALFLQVEDFAKAHGAAVVVVEGYFAHLKDVEAWVQRAQKSGFAFIPVSALYQKLDPSVVQNESKEPEINRDTVDKPEGRDEAFETKGAEDGEKPAEQTPAEEKAGLDKSADVNTEPDAKAEEEGEEDEDEEEEEAADHTASHPEETEPAQLASASLDALTEAVERALSAGQLFASNQEALTQSIEPAAAVSTGIEVMPIWLSEMQGGLKSTR